MEKLEELLLMGNQKGDLEASNLTLCVVDFINTLDEWEFVDKLARALYVHTTSHGVRVMTKNYIKIIGSSSGMPVTFSSENIKMVIHLPELNKSDVKLINAVSIIAELHYRNIQKHSEILHFALYDALTGAYTRSAGMKLIESAFEGVKRTGRKAFIAFFDIDNLKKVNDTYGHLKGDEMLVKFAQTCLNNIRKSDILVRYGGDEFILFIDSDNPRALMDRIKKSCEVQFSYGIVQIKNEDSISELINSVDKLMYHMKSKKKREQECN